MSCGEISWIMFGLQVSKTFIVRMKRGTYIFSLKSTMILLVKTSQQLDT